MLTSLSNNWYFGDDALPEFIKYLAELSMLDLAVKGEETHHAPRRSNALCHRTFYQHKNLWRCQHFPGVWLRALHSGWHRRSSELTCGAQTHTGDLLVFVVIGATLSISRTYGLLSVLRHFLALITFYFVISSKKTKAVFSYFVSSSDTW